MKTSSNAVPGSAACAGTVILCLALALTGVLPSFAGQAPESIAFDNFEEPDEPGCLMPIHGNLRSVKTNLSVKAKQTFRLEIGKKKYLTAGINQTDGDVVVNHQIQRLVEYALEQNVRLAEAEKARKHYRTVAAKTAAKSKDALNIMIAYRGFSTSSEAGDVLLDEKLKLKNLAASELACQKEVDENHLAVVKGLMQVAMGLGVSDVDRQTDVVMSGASRLEALVGGGDDSGCGARAFYLAAQVARARPCLCKSRMVACRAG